MLADPATVVIQLENPDRAVELQQGASELAVRLDDGSAAAARLREPAQKAEARLADLLEGLEQMSIGKGDPQYPGVLRAGGEPTSP